MESSNWLREQLLSTCKNTEIIFETTSIPTTSNNVHSDSTNNEDSAPVYRMLESSTNEPNIEANCEIGETQLTKTVIQQLCSHQEHFE